MTNTKRLTAALVLSIAATGIALPAFAGTASTFDSNLQAIGPELAARAAQRMAVMRDCKKAAASHHQPTDRYRTCMAEHGQAE